jgi:hypothetical protein
MPKQEQQQSVLQSPQQALQQLLPQWQPAAGRNLVPVLPQVGYWCRLRDGCRRLSSDYQAAVPQPGVIITCSGAHLLLSLQPLQVAAADDFTCEVKPLQECLVASNHELPLPAAHLPVCMYAGCWCLNLAAAGQ